MVVYLNENGGAFEVAAAREFRVGMPAVSRQR